MGGTDQGLPYPDPDDLLADTDLAIKALAEAIAEPTDTSVAGVSMAAGWSTPVIRSRPMVGGSLSLVTLRANRTGATITAAGTGNITDTTIMTLPVDLWPSRTQWIQANRSTVGLWQCWITPAGLWEVLSGPPTATINAGDYLEAQALIELF